MLTHETSRVIGVSANLSINFNQPLHDDFLDLLSIQGEFQAITQKYDQR